MLLTYKLISEERPDTTDPALFTSQGQCSTNQPSPMHTMTHTHVNIKCTMVGTSLALKTMIHQSNRFFQDPKRCGCTMVERLLRQMQAHQYQSNWNNVPLQFRALKRLHQFQMMHREFWLQTEREKDIFIQSQTQVMLPWIDCCCGCDAAETAEATGLIICCVAIGCCCCCFICIVVAMEATAGVGLVYTTS